MESFKSQIERPSVDMSWVMQSQSFLCTLGDVARLRLNVDLSVLAHQLASFDQDWRPYNSLKPHIRREGLSLTSLDGQMGGIPDLESLREVNQRDGSKYKELDFFQPTRAYRECSALHSVLDYFTPLGRSHLLRFGAGGFFPPHRDLDLTAFRIVVPCFNSAADQFIFMVDDKRLDLLPGSAYFVNTRKAHSLFSFVEGAMLLVLNVSCTPASCRKVEEVLAIV